MKKVINILKKVVILGHPNALFAIIMNFLGIKMDFLAILYKTKVVTIDKIEI